MKDRRDQGARTRNNANETPTTPSQETDHVVTGNRNLLCFPSIFPSCSHFYTKGMLLDGRRSPWRSGIPILPLSAPPLDLIVASLASVRHERIGGCDYHDCLRPSIFSSNNNQPEARGTFGISMHRCAGIAYRLHRWGRRRIADSISARSVEPTPLCR